MLAWWMNSWSLNNTTHHGLPWQLYAARFGIHSDRLAAMLQVAAGDAQGLYKPHCTDVQGSD
jgi:hypothetical protein